MNGRKNPFIFTALISLIFMWGCAPGLETFKIGEDFSKNKRWEDAIPYYEEAVKKNPTNKEYQLSLLKAKQESAIIHYEIAQKEFSSNPNPNIPALDKIFKEIDTAYNRDPQNRTIAALYNELKKKRDDLLANIELLYGQAESDMKNKDWLTAINKLTELNKIFPDYEDTDDRLSTARQEGAKLFYKQGLTLSKQEDWKMAAQAFKTAMDFNPNYFDVAKLYKEALDKDNVNYFINSAEKAIQAENWNRAIMLYEKALEYQPDNEELFSKLENMKVTTAELFFDEAVNFSNQEKLYLAFEKLDKAIDFAPYLLSNFSSKKFINELEEKLMNRANKYSEQKMYGNAMVWFQKLEALNPDYKDLFHKTQKTKDNINKRVKKSIAVFDFSSPSNAPDAGKIAATKLTTFLYKNVSKDVKIIERENLESILNELQLSKSGLVDAGTVRKLGKMGGIDTFIMGAVLHYSSISKDYPSTSQVKVLLDTEMVSNPEYTLWLIMHPKPTREDLRSAPPKQTEKKKYQFISYRKGFTRITFSLEFSYKLVSADTGENLFNDSISGKLIKEDQYQDGVSMANIPMDILDLPTEQEVADELTNQKITEMGHKILKSFQNMQVEYFRKGQEQYKRRQYENAIEEYTNAIFDEKLKSISTPISQKALEMIDNLTKNM